MLNTIDRVESEVRGYVRSYPTVFDTALGAILTNSGGKQFIDFFAGAGTLNYGHNNPVSNQALLDYIQRGGIQHGLDKATTAKIDFLQTFEELILQPRGMDFKVQFTGPTGTNSVEAAIKLARKVKQRSHIVAFTNAYHGHSLGSLALTANQYYHDEHYGSHNNVTHLPFDKYFDGVDSSEMFRKMLDDPSSGLPKPAAVILETIQCEGGINVASFEWLQKIVQLCKERDILVIFDEIQIGNGRTGRFFSFEDAGVMPDIICLSKAIGGGLPMSLVLIERSLDQWKPGEHTGTFRGNNLAFVASRAVLEYWRTDQLETHIAACGKMIHDRLVRISHRCSANQFDVRGRGMVWGIEVGDGEVARKIIQHGFDHGLIIETAGASDQVVKLLPPLTITKKQLTRGLDLLEKAFEAVLPAPAVPLVCDLPSNSITSMTRGTV
jgi:diaminobutyrate-2-oxoglutarate transaminase